MEIKNKAAAAVLVFTLLAPSAVFAANSANSQNKDNIQNQKVNNFCSNLSKLSSQITEMVNKTGQGLSDKQGQRMQNVQKREKDKEQKISDARSEAELKREAVYKKLESNASTSAQKEAVAQFKKTMEAAIQERKGAVNEASAAYWKGVNDLLKARQTAVQNAQKKFSDAIDATVKIANQACSANPVPSDAKSKFQSAVQAAKKQFIDDRKGIEKYGPQIKESAETRNKAAREAFDKFHKTAEQARIELKKVFPVNSGQ